MLKRYFLSNLIVVVMLNLLIKPVWIFLIDRNVQLTVGHQEYGLYSALTSLSIIFSIVLDFGITNYNNRNIANDHTQIHFTLPNMIVAKMLLSLIYFLLIFCIAFVFHYSGRAFYILLLLGGVQFLNSFLLFLRSNVSANHDFKIDSVLSVLDKLVMIIVCGFLLVAPFTKQLFRIEWYLYTQLGAYLIAIGAAVMVIIKRYAQIDFSHFSWLEVKAFCLKSLPYALLILLMGIYMRSDSLLLERLKGPEVNSIYAEAYRILDALNMIGFLLAGILLPMFTRMIANKINVHEIVKTSANILLSVSLCIVAHSLIYHQEIMFFLDKRAAPELPLIYMLVIGSFPAYCAMYIYSTLLTANGDISLLIKISILGCILSIGLNLLLIPLWQGVGAGLTALCVQTVVSGCCIYFSIRKFKWPIDFAWIGKLIFLFFSFLIINQICKLMAVSFLVSALISAVLFIIIVYLIKLWNKETIISYWKQYKSSE